MMNYEEFSKILFKDLHDALYNKKDKDITVGDIKNQLNKAIASIFKDRVFKVEVKKDKKEQNKMIANITLYKEVIEINIEKWLKS